MLIKGTKTQEVEIEVSEEEIVNTFLDLLSKKLNLSRGYYVIEDKVFKDEIFYTSHSDIIRTKNISVSDEKLEQYKLLENLEQIKDKLC